LVSPFAILGLKHFGPVRQTSNQFGRLNLALLYGHPL
jgi:hypothetical protein